eukprot:TRINITY_DN14775_c0_g3_i1.p1 TRINITY_DN14775_c0_g3~~TRINITY_DN14775_c0_g3_i1.p1  ORF type:complete len:103 (-),score=9.38 TRINITY_DN14775_c0_g3_i1:123-431(-)
MKEKTATNTTILCTVQSPQSFFRFLIFFTGSFEYSSSMMRLVKLERPLAAPVVMEDLLEFLVPLSGLGGVLSSGLEPTRCIGWKRKNNLLMNYGGSEEEGHN